MKYWITILLLSIVHVARAQLPIAEQSPAPSGPWTVVPNAEVIDLGRDCYSLVISEVSDLNESQYFRLRFPAGQEAVNARRMNYNSHLCQWVIEFFPSEDVPIIMVPVEGGKFLMGDEWGDGASDERPLHEVTVNSFYMSKYEVTNEQMRKVMQWAYKQRKFLVDRSNVKTSLDFYLLHLKDFTESQLSWTGSGFAVDSGKNNYPCIGVTWDGSLAFCNYLSEMEGLTPYYTLTRSGGIPISSCDWTANGYRLPTEAEWEYAAKGGLHGVKTKYAGSNDLGEVGWHDLDELDWNDGYGMPVGLKAANELGLYDMTGNVREWCWDRYNSLYYTSSPSIDPRGPEENRKSRVRRGGSWQSSAESCRVADREYLTPNYSYETLGFRVVRSVHGR